MIIHCFKHFLIIQNY